MKFLLLIQNVECSCDIFTTEIGYPIRIIKKKKNQIAEVKCVLLYIPE